MGIDAHFFPYCFPLLKLSEISFLNPFRKFYHFHENFVKEFQKGIPVVVVVKENSKEKSVRRSPLFHGNDKTFVKGITKEIFMEMIKLL